MDCFTTFTMTCYIHMIYQITTYLIMHLLFYFIITLLIISVIFLYKKHKKSNAPQKLFDDLYINTYGAQLSKQDRESLLIKDDFSLTYGEICFDSFMKILAKTQPKPADIFYDLGAGTGKAVITAALSNNFSKCVGIEILPSLYQVSLEKLAILQKEKMITLTVIEFIQADFFKLDFLNANVIFINATGFFGELYDDLVAILKKLHAGTRIIITSKLLPVDDFELIHQDLYLMSWGFSRVSVYLR